MSTIDDNILHSDPGVEAHGPRADRRLEEETAQQRDRAVTIFEKSKAGRRAFVAPALDVPERPLDELLPAQLRRAEPPRLPEIAEPEIVRHYNRLSKRNFDLDTGFYPLGSCTMKHNPKLHERVAALPGNARLHPAQSPRRAQGALQLMWELQQALGEIAGLPHVSLQPSAGSHGELAGVLLTRAYHEDRGEHRPKVLTPDTAHGTNPATVTMAGYEVVKVGTDARGGVDVEDLRAKADEDVACLMLTNPNTLGLFDENIEEIAKIVHGVGATLYYDGANLNAVMGRTRPGDMGFDIVHFNLHKTFTQPHGGGGPGAGPIAVSDRIEPYLPRPQVVRREIARTAARRSPPSTSTSTGRSSIGRLRGFQGNYGVFVRSYAYILSLGGDGLHEASETAVLNANYLLARLSEQGVAEYLPVAYDRICMHEFVLSGAPMKKALGLQHARPRQAAARPRLPPADGLLPAARRRGAAGRADRDRDQGDARRLRRRGRRDPARGRRGSGDRPQRPVHDAGPPARRGRRRQAAGDPPAAVTVIFSGIQPTGRKHLGNYIGAILQYVAGQERGDPAIYCIVDLHAITVDYDPKELRERVYDTAAVLLAAGLDPERCLLFRQGDVQEHTELSWLLSSVTPIGELNRMHQFRDKSVAQRELVSAGLLFYPVLQAADVLAYRAHEVPVGEDQREHLELMRDIAERFNRRFGETLIVPEPTDPRGRGPHPRPPGARAQDVDDGRLGAGDRLRARRARRDPAQVQARGHRLRRGDRAQPGQARDLQPDRHPRRRARRQPGRDRARVRRQPLRRLQDGGRRRGGRLPRACARALRRPARRRGLPRGAARGGRGARSRYRHRHAGGRSRGHGRRPCP